MDLDEILPDVGEFGTYQQLLLYFVLLPCVLPCGFHAYNQLFMTARPDHWCRVPELEHLDPIVAKNLSIPVSWREGMPVYSHCSMYALNYSALSSVSAVQSRPNVSTVSCTHGWSFDYSKYATTVVTEWDLVCHKDYYATLALVLLGVGGLIGNYIFGYLQDSIGRQPSFFIYLIIECFFGIASAFAQDYFTWTAFRVGVGFTVPAILGTPYVLAIELVGPSHRTLCSILSNIAYSIGLVALSAVVYLVRDWRQLALATSIPFLSFFLYWWVLPESPRWLLARGRFEEAEKILKKMARINGKSLPANYMVHLKRKFQVERYMQQKKIENDNVRQYGVMDLFRTPNMRRKTIIITFIWFTNTSVYVGLSYYAPALGGDEFLNFFLASAVELPTYIVLWPAMEYCGRRWILCFCMTVGGLACVATFISQANETWTLVLYCIGKMGISSSYVVLPLMASELYPTVVRGLGMSTSGVVGMLGPIFIPLVNYMGEDMLVLPLIIMGVLLIAGGGCSLLLPETANMHLPQSLEDGENFGREWFSCCPTKVGIMNLAEEKPKNMSEDSPIKSLLTVTTKETPSSTPVVTDATSSTDVTSESVLSVNHHEQTMMVTVV